MKLFLPFIFFFLTTSLYCEDDQITSIREDRIRILKYGIDDEVVDVILSIKNEKDESYNNDLLEILITTGNTKIILPILILFEEQETDIAADFTLSVLKDASEDYTVDQKVLSASVVYSGVIKNINSVPYLYELSNYKTTDVASEVIRVLGKIGDTEFAERFLERIQDDDFDDNEAILRESSILLMGDLKYEPAVLTLIDIVQDESYSTVARRYASDSLGKIGDEQAIPVLKELLNDSDSILRSYALTSLAYFDTDEIESILVQSLRDSYWRIRVAACKALSERKSSSSVDILIYKSEKDPEPNVRKAAIAALAVIGGRDAWNFLSDFYKDSSNTDLFRSVSLNALLNEKPEKIIDSIKIVFEEEWEKDSSWILNYTCKELSVTESGDLLWCFSKMLDHSNYIIRIYAVRGIRLNNYVTLYSRVREIADNENEIQQLRKEASSL